MRIQHFHDPRTGTLTYVVSDEDSLTAVVIDSVMDYDAKSGRVFFESAENVASYIDERGRIGGSNPDFGDPTLSPSVCDSEGSPALAFLNNATGHPSVDPNRVSTPPPRAVLPSGRIDSIRLPTSG